MTLTAQEQREMYADIKVIKNNCVRCFKCQEDHETRLKKVENFIRNRHPVRRPRKLLVGLLRLGGVCFRRSLRRA